jgi:hypothetical protein
VLVRANADERRLHAIDRRIEAFELDAAELIRESLLHARIEETPERHAAPDEVLPHPALRLVQPERRACADGQVREPSRDLMLVQPVAVLVHRGEERLEAVLVVVRRDADVVDAGAGGERMLGGIDAPRVGPVAEEVDDLVVERDLAVEWEVAAQERVVCVAIAQLRDQRDELVLDLLEDACDVGRLHLRLEVVQEDVVGLVLGLEALDVASAELDVALERPEEELEVRRLLRLLPYRVRLGGGDRHLTAQLDRNLNGLVVHPAREPKEAGVVGVGVERGAGRLELVEQAADLGIGQLLVREALHERDVLCAMADPRRRHRRVLVPHEQVRDVGQPVQVCKACFQPVERVSHGQAPY